MSDLEIRDIPLADVDQMMDLADLVFHHRTPAEDRERELWAARRAERLAAYVDDVSAGQAAVLPMRLAVPGAFLDCSAITFVGVLPTHRRRGVLTAMMERMLTDAAAANRPVAALWASQSAIYGRYGFGLADRAISLEIDTSRPLALRTEPDPRPLRLIDRDSAPEILGPIHTRALARRPGGLVRDAEWWDKNMLPAVDDDDEDFTEPRVAVLDGEPGGYVIYRTHGEGTGHVRIDDLVADTPQVEAALWRYLASIDLTTKIKAPSRPVDDLIPHMVADFDRVEVTGSHGALWVRLVDAPAALRARSWATGDSLVIELLDERLPANQGRWRLAAGTCDRTEDALDLTLSAADLGAAYLGGTSVSTLARIGVVTEHTPDAAARLDRAFAVPLAPYTNDDF
ncbi:GNAT family N-acetyltransferase [Actinomadura sp. NEAU-AAG7]|uniref:GNAT family N-acetyltransferase n=1 Tax=Actinomadura sp. NEAU-AAG7 TaxID=2839640 RepID=UPI001BE3DACA|nr:GNAT family N-acetyltransferase [Actinomadura sp. NEAU-AAG7]MBT2211191.1 GNAT family N-acetyltransferase [Actinomadura sp. NEAU-AAG7]